MDVLKFQAQAPDLGCPKDVEEVSSPRHRTASPPVGVLFSLRDDATVVAACVSQILGPRHQGLRRGGTMAMPQSLEDRVGILEEQMGKLDGLPEAVQALTSQISQLSVRMEAEFSAIRKQWDAKLEERFREEGEMLDERFAQVAQRVEVDRRFAQIDRRFAQVDRRFAQMERRFTKVERRFTKVDQHLMVLRQGVRTILKKLEAR